MSTPLLTTKLYIPPVRPDPSTTLRTGLVSRPRLIEQLNAALVLGDKPLVLWPRDTGYRGLHHKLTLISAPAGFGKTTLLSEWTHLSRRAAAGERGPLHCVRRMTAAPMQNEGCSPAAEVESDLANPGPGGRAARRGRDEAIRRETSPRPRAFRPPAPVVVGEAGRRAL